VFIGEDLWVACDELTSVERLSPRQQYANGPATGGRGKFDTSSNPVVF
jgi:hypothetical protein